MRDKLEQYVNLLFAGAADCEDIRQEILQNTLDRYDDLIAEGKVPEAAYRLAIAGIGDVNEILGTKAPSTPLYPSRTAAAEPDDEDTPKKKMFRAIAVGMYILCPIPLLLLADTGLEILGVCILLAIVAIATVIMVLCAKKDDDEEKEEDRSPNHRLKKSIESLVWAIGLVVYFAVSFLTWAWHITWIIFLITGAVEGLINAIVDLKEARKNEN